MATAICLVGCNAPPDHFIGAAHKPCACKQDLEGNQSIERITDLASFQNNLNLVTKGRSEGEIAAIIQTIQVGCGFTDCCCSEDLHALGHFFGSASSTTKDRISDFIIDSRFPGAAISPTWPASSDGLQYAPNCTPYPGKRIIVVTVSIDFFDMFRNWFHTAMTYIDSKTNHLIVYPYDKLVVLKLQEMNSNLSVPFEIGKNQHSRRLMDFDSPGYMKLVDQRPGLIKFWLDKNCTVFYVDIDTVWARPVFPAMAAAAGSRSLYILRDGNDTNYCTCFIYANPVFAVKKLMTDWLVRLHGTTVNQPSFNAALKTMYVDYALLPREEFPDGQFADAHNLNKSAVVLHANFRIGLDAKIAFFKQRHFWFV